MSSFLRIVFICAILFAAQRIHAQPMKKRERRSYSCTTFVSTICAISVSKIKREHCESCKFDVQSLFKCPIVAGGYYAYRTGQSEGGGCNQGAFMAHGRIDPPLCGDRCCRTDHHGEFKLVGASNKTTSREDMYSSSLMSSMDSNPAKWQFQPSHKKCRYTEINRGQVMRLLSKSKSIVVIGDSTMRQLYLRLIAMMRGQKRMLDLHVHTHIQYFVCREVDFLRLSTNRGDKEASPSDSWFLKHIISAFFSMEIGPGREDAARVLSECSTNGGANQSSSLSQINYMQAPLYMAQAEMLQTYIKSQKQADAKPICVISVGFRQTGSDVPAAYLQALRDVEDKVSRIVYIGVPTVDVRDQAQKKELVKRNEFMKGWIDGQTNGKYLYVDVDALASAPNAPRGTKGSKHYQCWIEWTSSQFPFGTDNPSGMSQFHGSVEKIHPDVQGECADEMNRNIWQIILNGLYSSMNNGEAS